MKIAQCWDDGVIDDIRLIEIFRKHEAKASFNLCYGNYRDDRYSNWKFQGSKEVWMLSSHELTEVYDGFLVANHTLTHPNLLKISLSEAEREICEGKESLEQLFGYEVKGFAYPFGEHSPAISDIIKMSGHHYARTTGMADCSSPPVDPMAFHPNCHFKDPFFWDKYECAKEQNGLFYFWGHSYEMITEKDWQVFEANIARLSTQPDVEWVDLPGLFRNVS